MKRIIELLIITFFILIPGYPTAAQQADNAVLIGVLAKGSASEARHKALLEGLGEFGYLEGENIRFEHRYGNGNGELLPSLAAELVQLDVDVILALGCPAADTAKEATKTIPIVTFSANPVMTGLVTSFARPGGNITGMTLMTGSNFYSKRLELLKQVAPSAKLVAVFLNSTINSHRLSLNRLKSTAAGFGMTLLPLDAQTPDDINIAFSKMREEHAEALLNFGDPLFTAHRKQIADFAIENRLPTNLNHEGYVKAGALMFYGPEPVNLYRDLGSYVGKILQGAKPADLPIEQPTAFDLVINLKTAEKLGLTIPPEVLLQATKVIK